MFENIIGQDALVDRLRRDLGERRLPQALVIDGPRYAGKLSIALEIARALTCRKDAAWSCDCGACVQQRGLSHADTLLLGPHRFEAEVRAAVAAFERAPRLAGAYLSIRALRKLARRFDPQLWPDTRIAKAAPALKRLEEPLQDAETAARRSDWDAFTTVCTACVAQVPKIVAAAPKDLLPVDLIRALGARVRRSSFSRSQVVVVEEPQTASAATLNALLKLLEEPPAATYFVFCSTAAQALPDTIRSRVRRYYAPARSSAAEAEVLRRIFHTEAESLAAAIDGSGWHAIASGLLAACSDGADPLACRDAIESALAEAGSGDAAVLLIEALADTLRTRLRRRDAPVSRRFADLARHLALARLDVQQLHLNATAVLHELLYAVGTAP